MKMLIRNSLSSFFFLIACPILCVGDPAPFVAGLQINRFRNFIDIISLPECTLLQSFPVDRDATHVGLKDRNTIFIPFRGNYERGYHQILELSLLTKKTTLWARPLSATPGKIMVGANLYWVCFDHIIKPEKDLKNSRAQGLTDYQESGFEMYSKDQPAKLVKLLRLGEFHHVFEWCWNKEKTRIYLISSPFAVRDSKTQIRQFYKHWPAYIQVIDTQKQKVIQILNISNYIEDLSGLSLQDGKLYICGIRDPNLKGLELPTSASRYLHVFDEKTLKHERSIEIDFFPAKIVGSDEDHRVFVLHKLAMKSSQTSIVVINTKTDQYDSKIEFPNIQKIIYGGKQRLFIITPEELIVIDTKTLEVVKKIQKTYAFINSAY